MNCGSTLTFNVVILTIAVLLQTILLIGIALSLAKMRRSVEQFTSDVHRFLETASRRVETLHLNATHMGQKVQSGLQHAGCISDEVLARSRAHALSIDRLAGDFLLTAEFANHELRRITSDSFREVRALKAGLQAALRILFKRHRSEAWVRSISASDLRGDRESV